jgi:hypothetical protein
MRQSVTARISVRLVNGSGVPVTGMLPANVASTSAYVKKSDGTLATISLVNGSTWFEVDSTKFPGLYDVLVPGSALSLIGQTQLSVQPAAAAFVGTILSFEVEVAPADAAFYTSARGTKLDALDSVATLVSQLQDLTDERFGKWVIETTGPDANRLVLYKLDGITILKKFNLADINGDPNFINPFSRTPV